MTIPIEVGTRVTLNFALVLEDGEVVDSNFDAPPASFTIGDGNLLPGFEEPLVGLSSGDENEFLIAPEKAFGQRMRKCQHSGRKLLGFPLFFKGVRSGVQCL